MPNHSKLHDLSSEDFLHLYSVNVVGPFQMIRATRSLLEAGAKANSRNASVVNVSSIAAINGTGSSVAYVASKGALNSMTTSLSRALAPMIRVNSVCPGYIDTRWHTVGHGEEVADTLREKARESVALKIASTPEDIAELVVFMASTKSYNMTGEIIRIDAGMHLVIG